MNKTFSRLISYIKLLRPELMVMDITLPAVSAVLAVTLKAGFEPGAVFPYLGSIAAVTLAAYLPIVASYVFNDFLDIDIDTINLPERPLPKGKLLPSEALVYSILLYAGGIVIFAFYSWYSVLTVIIATAVITIYSAVMKRRTPLSFLPVGIAYGLVPIGVWFAFDTPNLTGILLAVMICVTDWGFTLSGVSRDVAGDSEKGAPTLPVKKGIPFTAKFIFACWCAGVVISGALTFTADLSVFYLCAAGATGAWLLWNSARFIKEPTSERGGRFFLQAANYRGALFLCLILDVAIRLFREG